MVSGQTDKQIEVNERHSLGHRLLINDDLHQEVWLGGISCIEGPQNKEIQLYIIYVTSLYIPLKTLTENILFELPFLLLGIHGIQNSNNKYTISSSA